MRPAEAAGALLAASLLTWLAGMTGLHDGSSTGPLMVVMGTVAAFGAARVLARRNNLLVPLVVLFAAAGFAVLRVDVLFDGPLRAPFGYSNAAGSLFMLASAAAALCVVRSSSLLLRCAAALCAAVIAVGPVLNGTRTAAVLLLLLPLALGAALLDRGRAFVAVSAVIVVLATATTVALAASYHPGRPRTGSIDHVMDATLSERRAELWADAVALAVHHPITGIGPGRFPSVSEAARRDREMPYAHHEFLQLAAEAGLPAALLCFALLAWAFLRLWHSPDPPVAAIGAFTLAAATVHASVDFVFHFPAIPIAAAALVGAAMTRPRSGQGAYNLPERPPHRTAVRA